MVSEKKYISRRPKKEENPLTRDKVTSLFVGSTAGSASYFVQMSAVQYLFRSMYLHSGFPYFSSLVGATALSLSFSSSTWAMLCTSDKLSGENSSAKFTYSNMGVCNSINLLIYRIQFKEFRSALPSHIILPGSFSNTGLKVSPGPLNKTTKQFVQQLGFKSGCHHCGVKVPHYISDHIPCTTFLSQFSALARNKPWNLKFIHWLYGRDILTKGEKPQSLFPQCRPCSNRQGGYVNRRPFFNALFNKKGIVLPKLKFRLYFLSLFPIHLIFNFLDS